jgi:transglutaminase-like putative cysteine protease
MKRILLLTAILAVSLAGFCSDINYDTKLIADSMLKNANMVKRIDQTTLEIISTKEAVLHYRYAVTILNEKADRDAVYHEWYDKFRKVVSVEGALYDASGKLLKKLKKSDIADYSASDNISLMGDNRVKMYTFGYKIYPYTVEYETEIKYNQTFLLPSWNVIDEPNESVEQSSFLLIAPEDYLLRYKSSNIRTEPNILVQKGKKMISWEVKNILPIEMEYAMPDFSEVAPTVRVSPSSFEIDGYKGNMTSWNDFGKFLYDLKKDRDELPDNVKQKAIQLVAGITDEKEKVKKLYEFLQQNTRYISIQLGIGGFQPFDANYVASKGYGDCKALSNYMYSLLKAVGITSKYVIIQAGPDYYMREDFPSNQFNHATLCVPMEKDTMWLECTSQTVPAGYQGNFTGNRKALLVDETGGTLVNTKKYGLNENVAARKITGTVSEDGNMNVTVRTKYRALKQDRLHQVVHMLSKEKIKEMLNDELGLPSYTINSFNYTENKAEIPEMTEDLDMSLDNYATLSGKRLFVMPNLLAKSMFKSSEKERKFDIWLRTASREIDTVEINVPAGYEPEALPAPVSLKTRYGSYSSSAKFENNKIIYYRVKEQYEGRYPASEYKEFAAYYDAVYKADRAKIVLVKK